MSADIKKTALLWKVAGVSGATAAAMNAATKPVLGPVTVAVVGYALTAFKKKYNSFKINEKTAPVDPVSEKWKTRPKANMVKWMMKQSGVGLESIAEHLGCSISYVNTKLARDSFSFEDLIIIAYACGFTFVLADNKGEGEAVYRVDLIRHFENNEPEVLERIDQIEERAQKRDEYEKEKAEMELEMERRLQLIREKYGIEE